MKNFIKILVTVLTIITGIATMVAFYWDLTEKRPLINMKLISLENPMAKPRISELKAHYTFRDSTINNLWVAYYIFENNGNQTIIGTGTNKNIIVDTLSLRLPENFRFLKIEIRNRNFPVEARIADIDRVNLKFLQWRPDEYFEVMIYLEGLKRESNDTTIVPRIILNEREILNAEVKQTTLSYSDQEKKTLASLYLPTFLYWTLFAIGIGFFTMGFLAVPIIIVSEIVSTRKFQVWLKKYGALFEQWSDQMRKQNKNLTKFLPSSTPSELWKDFPGERPTIPEFYGDIRSLVLLILLLLILTIIPLLWMIRI